MATHRKILTVFLLVISLAACSFPAKQANVLIPTKVVFYSDDLIIEVKALNNPLHHEGALRVQITKNGVTEIQKISWDKLLAEGLHLKSTGAVWASEDWTWESYDSQELGQPKKLVSEKSTVELFAVHDNLDGTFDLRVVEGNRDEILSVTTNPLIVVPGVVVRVNPEVGNLELRFDEEWQPAPATWRND